MNLLNYNDQELSAIDKFLREVTKPLPIQKGSLVSIDAFGEGYVTELDGKKAVVWRHHKNDEWRGNIKKLTCLDTDLSVMGIRSIKEAINNRRSQI